MRLIVLILFTLTLSAKELVMSSIAPINFLVKEIAGDEVTADVLIPEGKDPHTFSLKIRTVTKLNRSKIFFHVGAPFEKQLLKKISHKNIVDLSHGIRKVEQHAHHHHHGHHQMDPHIWLGPDNLITIAKTIASKLSVIAPRKKIEENLSKIIEKLQKVDRLNKRRLRPFKGKTVLVFHPAFEYFLSHYGIKQMAIEHQGKTPSPKKIRAIIQKCQSQGIRVIFSQPQFDNKAALTIAKQIRGKVIPVNPLAADILSNLLAMADTIEEALKP